LHDHRTFGQLLPIVHFEDRHLVLRIDARKHRAVGGLALGAVELRQLQIDAGFAGNDVGRERTGAGPVIKFHDEEAPENFGCERPWPPPAAAGR
jgi:hypothetical protein